jgi:hypothetical protein
MWIQRGGSSVALSVPTAAFASRPLVTNAGQIHVSRQFLQTAGTGIAGDPFADDTWLRKLKRTLLK